MAWAWWGFDPVIYKEKWGRLSLASRVAAKIPLVVIDQWINWCFFFEDINEMWTLSKKAKHGLLAFKFSNKSIVKHRYTVRDDENTDIWELWIYACEWLCPNDCGWWDSHLHWPLSTTTYHIIVYHYIYIYHLITTRRYNNIEPIFPDNYCTVNHVKQKIDLQESQNFWTTHSYPSPRLSIVSGATWHLQGGLFTGANYTEIAIQRLEKEAEKLFRRGAVSRCWTERVGMMYSKIWRMRWMKRMTLWWWFKPFLYQKWNCRQFSGNQEWGKFRIP